MSEKSEKSSENPSPSGNTASNDDTEYVKPYMAKENDDLGYFFFPNRNPNKVASEESRLTFKHILKTFTLRGSATYDHIRCKNNMQHCVTKDAKVEMMIRALHAHGCPVSLKRHISCEPCNMKMSGGYDFYNAQVVVCENTIKTKPPTCNVLAHELLHAFDDCRAKFDVKNIEHLACTEIRAANLFHCSLKAAFAYGEVTPINVKDRHQYCVRHKAAMAVQMARNVSEFEAHSIIDKVFAKCYSDFEPYGRRPRKYVGDYRRALQEGLLYGYVADENLKSTDL